MRFASTIAMLLLSVAAYVAALAPAHADKRVALVIGNSGYLHANKLINPENDANDVAEVLRGLNFEVIVNTNVDRRGLERSLEDFERKAKGADAALFFFAGHGLQYQGRNFLLPVDANLEDEVSLKYDTLPVEKVREALDSAAGVKLLILDACRNNPLARRLQPRTAALTRSGAGLTRGLARLDRTEGMVVAYATQADQVAQDGSGRNSPFSGALIKRMREPNLEIAQLFRRVAQEVNEQTGGKQTPEVAISLLQDFYLNLRDDDSRVWRRLGSDATEEQLREFITKFPSSAYVRDAQSRLSMLERLRIERDAVRLERERIQKQIEALRAEQERLAQQQAAERERREADRQRIEKAEQEKRDREKAEQQRIAIDRQKERERQERENKLAEQRLAEKAAEERKRAEVEQKKAADAARKAEDERRRADMQRDAEQKRLAELAAEKARKEAEQARKAEERQARVAALEAEKLRKQQEENVCANEAADIKSASAARRTAALEGMKTSLRCARLVADIDKAIAGIAKAQEAACVAEDRALKKIGKADIATLKVFVAGAACDGPKGAATAQIAALEAAATEMDRSCASETDRFVAISKEEKPKTAKKTEFDGLLASLKCAPLRPKIADAIKQIERETTNTPEQVKAVQVELRRIGCYAGNATGVLDPATKTSLDAYLKSQKDGRKNLQVGDGLVGELRGQPTSICPPPSNVASLPPAHHKVIRERPERERPERERPERAHVKHHPVEKKAKRYEPPAPRAKPAPVRQAHRPKPAPVAAKPPPGPVATAPRRSQAIGIGF